MNVVRTVRQGPLRPTPPNQRDKQLPKAKTPHESEALQRQIAFTDGQIDELVYELYGLTKDEIRVVEGAANG
jgi:hypothetical protein